VQHVGVERGHDPFDPGGSQFGFVPNNTTLSQVAQHVIASRTRIAPQPSDRRAGSKGEYICLSDRSEWPTLLP
jgi:hypothetical protein